MERSHKTYGRRRVGLLRFAALCLTSLVAAAALQSRSWVFILGSGQIQAKYGRRPVRRTGLRASSSKEGDLQIALVVPGLLYGASAYEELCSEMTANGYPTVAVPVEWWHWIPCLGGRSVRPILERIDYTVDHLLQHGAATPVPPPKYSALDFFQDFLNNPGGVLSVGGSADPDAFPSAAHPEGADFSPAARLQREEAIASSKRRLAIVGHSAGGWISRIYLADKAYGGRPYCGGKKVHSLVTLGSPHAAAPGVAFKNVEWLSKEGSHAAPSNYVRCLAVGSTGLKAKDATDFTRGAYRFCGQEDPSTDGDGVTPLESALAFDHAERLALDGATHAPNYPSVGPTAELARRRNEGQPWYGSSPLLDQWLSWLKSA